MVNKFLYPRGGAESYMLGVGKHFEAQGHHVEYFGMYDEKNTVGNSAHEYTTNMDFHGKTLSRFLYPLRIVYSREARRKIGKVLDTLSPDVVHMNNINFQLTPAIIDAVKERGIPLVQTVHDYQMICPNHLLYDFGKKQVCEKCVGSSKMPCIKNRCIHGSLAKSVIGTFESFFYKKRGTYKKVDMYICPSEFLRGKLMKNAREVYDGRTTVLHNFVEKKTISPSSVSPFPFRYVAFAGRLSYEKGTAVLSEAAKLLPHVNFVVMGAGQEEKAFSGLPNVTMTGFVTGDTLACNIAFADVLAVPSVCYENCPLSILEARVLGVPSVTMNMGGMAELVGDGVTGVLSASPDPQDFAAALERVLSDDEKLEKMKKNCLDASREALSLDEYCVEVMKIYKSLI